MVNSLGGRRRRERPDVIPAGWRSRHGNKPQGEAGPHQAPLNPTVHATPHIPLVHTQTIASTSHIATISLIEQLGSRHFGSTPHPPTSCPSTMPAPSSVSLSLLPPTVHDANNSPAQPTRWRRSDDPQYADDPEFQALTTTLSDKLFTLTSSISRLNNQISLLGTRRETDRVRERVQDLLQETGDSFKDIGEGLKRVSAWEDLGPSQKYTQGKLNQEFRASLTEFQVLQRQALEKQRASATAARTALEQEEAAGSQQQGGGQQQQQQVQQQEPRLADQSDVDFQESLIIERESEIRNIEQSVGELNELFRDVAHMVHEQGQSLDIISDNVTQTRDDTRNADQQLRTASRHQKSARGKACCLLLILVIVLTVIIVAAVLG